MTKLDEIEKILTKFPHKFQVRFSLYCAKDVFHLVSPEFKPEIQKTLDLVQAWLDGKEVTSKELKFAANAAYYAAYIAASAATDAATDAAYSVSYTASAAYYIAATDAASASASSASASAYACAHASEYASQYDAEMNKYYEYLEVMIKDLSEVERIIWETE